MNWENVNALCDVVRETSYAIHCYHRCGHLEKIYENVAAALQLRLEEAILHLARGLQRRTGLKKLCMAGGVALNSVANGRILHETDFEEIFIQPAASDDGTSLGGAYFLWTCVLGGRRPEPMRHASLGPQFSVPADRPSR